MASQISEDEASEVDFRGDKIQKANLKFGMQVVLATRKPMNRPDMVMAGPDMARAGPKCHRSIFWAIGRV